MSQTRGRQWREVEVSGGRQPDGRKRFLAALVLLCVAVAGATWIVASRAKSPRQAAAEATAPRPSHILAPVEFRTLRRIVPVRGTVAAPAAVTVTLEPGEGEGAPVVTAAPLRAGARVDEGTLIAEVALRPVIVLSGEIPMFRDLSLGSSGRDVLQLQHALLRRGFAPETGGVLGPATAEALAALYAFHGYGLPSAGLPARRQRKARIALRSELVFVRRLPARLAGPAVRVGQAVRGPIARLVAGQPFVKAEATPADRDAIRVGLRAEIRVADRRFPARIAAIDTLTRRRGSDLRVYPLVVRPQRTLARRLVNRSVQVIITSKGTRGRQLVVPLAAVNAGADGSARVARVRDAETRPITVRPGLSANGFVAVRTTAGALRAGDSVVVGR